MTPSRLLITLTLCLLAFAAPAQSGAPVLHRGINLSSWMANAQRQPLYARDFMQIKEAGFDHVRLPFAPEYYGYAMGGTEAPETTNFLELDRAVGLAIGNGLAVIVDVHPGSDELKNLEEKPGSEQRLIDFWKVLAARYRDKPTNMLAFELLNEPQYYKREKQYADLVRRLVPAVRAIDADHLLIVGAPRGSSIDGLLKVEPVDDNNIAYDFHYYEPYIISHQGIHNGSFEGSMIPFIHKLPYPSSLAGESAGAYAENAPNPMQAQSEINEYRAANWDAAKIAEKIKVAKDWGEAHHVHLICSEFGAIRGGTDADSRYRFISDARQALEADGIGWELWDYTDLFGIVTLHGQTAIDRDGSVKFTGAAGSRRFDPQAFSALGLK